MVRFTFRVSVSLFSGHGIVVAPSAQEIVILSPLRFVILSAAKDLHLVLPIAQNLVFGNL